MEVCGDEKGDERQRREGESTIMGYYNEICKRDLERMAEMEGNPDYIEDEGAVLETELDSCVGFEDVCREFGPWVWSDEFQDYEASIAQLKGPQCRLASTVPKHVEEISKSMLKYKWDGADQECFDGFGPWCKPCGYKSPEPITPVQKTKKIRKRERPKDRLRDDAAEVKKVDEQSVKKPEKVPEIITLTSHKTYSTPVDPIELKKRLADLLIQRSAKGDQQAMELKKINMKPLYFQKFICNTNASSWMPRGHGEVKITTGPRPQYQAQAQYQLGQTSHRSQSENRKEPDNYSQSIKLPPVSKKAEDLSIVQRWPRVGIPHHVRKRNLHGRHQTKEAISEERQKIAKSKLKNVSMDDLVREPEIQDSDLANKRWGRKLGELSKNTKTEIFKQFSNFDI